MTYNMLFDNNRKEETMWIRMACWVQENQMNLMPSFKPQFDRDKKKREVFSCTFRQHFFGPSAPLAPDLVSTNRAKISFYQKGLGKGTKRAKMVFLDQTASVLSTKKVTERMRGVFKINGIAAVSSNIKLVMYR